MVNPRTVTTENASAYLSEVFSRLKDFFVPD